MDTVLGHIECGSNSDSIVMSILRSAMDKAHEKVQLKDGPIEFLHERSMFYELAAILVESGLTIVQGEIGVLEGNCDKILTDLLEIRHWLKGRIEDMKRLIVDKDRELMERCENEAILRQQVENKDRELVLLCQKLEPEGFKNESFQDISTGNGAAAEGDISRLKSSLDQQVWSIKQKLEDEEKCFMTSETKKIASNVSSPNLSFDFLYKGIVETETSDSNEECSIDRFSRKKLKNEVWRTDQNVLIRRMSSDIDVLKETLDLAFGKMQSAEVLPLEKQWRWTIEKDLESIMVKGFLHQMEENFGSEVRKEVNLVKDKWSDLMNEMQDLCKELDQNSYLMQQQSSTCPVVRRSSSEPLPDILTKDAATSNFVANMVRNHEIIIRKQGKEWYWLKGEVVLPRKGPLHLFEKFKDRNGLETRVRNVIARLDNLVKRNRGFGDRTCITRSNGESSLVCEDSLEEEEEMTRIKEERDGLGLQISLMEDTYSLLFSCMVKDYSTESCFTDSNNIGECYSQSCRIDRNRENRFDEVVVEVGESVFHETLESSLKEDVCMIFFKVMAEEWKVGFEVFAEESLVRNETHQFILVETVKNFQDSADQKQLHGQAGSPNSKTEGQESLILKIDSLLKCLETEEELMVRASSEIKEHVVSNDLVISNCEEVDERNALVWLLNDDESTLSSAREKLEKALHQLYNSKKLLVDLVLSLGVPPKDYENGDQLLDSNPWDEIFANVIHFQQEQWNFEHVTHANLAIKLRKLERLNSRVDELMAPAARMRTRKLLYKKAFESRCRNLRVAEREVDLLGDQVEGLLCLLERIYTELNRNAPAVCGYFEVFDMLKLIQKELNCGASSGK